MASLSLIRQHLFAKRVRVLQEEYGIPWEEAVAIANYLAWLVRKAEDSQFQLPPQGKDGPTVG